MSEESPRVVTRPRGRVVVNTDADFDFLNNRKKRKLKESFRNSETPPDWKPKYDASVSVKQFVVSSELIQINILNKI